MKGHRIMAEKRLCGQWEVFKVTKYLDGAIYKTEYTGKTVWIPCGIPVIGVVWPGSVLYVTPSRPPGPEWRTDWIDPTVSV